MKMTDVYVEWTFSKQNALNMLDMLTNEAKEVLGHIHNLHIAALGAKTQEESIQLEQSADESRKWFHWLKIMAEDLYDDYSAFGATEEEKKEFSEKWPYYEY